MTSNPSGGPDDGLDEEVLKTLWLLEQGEKIKLFRFGTPQMRAFHLSWFTFFLAFFGWFGIAPLMPIVREDLGLTHAQVGNTIIASVVATFFARMILGWFCDRYGARRTCTVLLMLGSLPVMGIGLSQSYEAFLLFRLAIGVIGAMFVITQYHMSVMFDPNVVGAANATTAGWGNLGGGVTQIVMPLVLGLVLWLGVDEFLGWRIAMVVPRRGAVPDGHHILRVHAGHAVRELPCSARREPIAAGLPGSWRFSGSGRRLPRMGAVPGLWRELRRGAYNPQRCGALLLR